MTRQVMVLLLIVTLCSCNKSNDAQLPSVSAAPAPASQSAIELPSFVASESYEGMVNKLRLAGWEPYREPIAYTCRAGAADCEKNLTESGLCLSGKEDCRVRWKKNEHVEAICTLDGKFSGICTTDDQERDYELSLRDDDFKSHVSEGDTLAAPALAAIGIACSSSETGTLTNDSLGLPEPGRMSGLYTEAVMVSGAVSNGKIAEIEVTYKDNSMFIGAAAGQSYSYKGKCSSFSMKWSVVANGTFPARYLPKVVQ